MNRILKSVLNLMVEQSQIGMGHDDTVLIAGGNDTSIIGGSCGTGYVGHAALEEYLGNLKKKLKNTS